MKLLRHLLKSAEIRRTEPDWSRLQTRHPHPTPPLAHPINPNPAPSWTKVACVEAPSGNRIRRLGRSGKGRGLILFKLLRPITPFDARFRLRNRFCRRDLAKRPRNARPRTWNKLSICAGQVSLCSELFQWRCRSYAAIRLEITT